MIAINGMIREEGIGVYILSNTDTEIRHALMWKVFDTFLGLPPRDWSTEMLAMYKADQMRDSVAARPRNQRVEGTKPSLPLGQYAGTFADPDSLREKVTITMEDGVLRYRLSSRMAGTLEHWQYDTFRVLWDDWWRGRSTITFTVGPNGSADRMDVGNVELLRPRR